MAGVPVHSEQSSEVHPIVVFCWARIGPPHAKHSLLYSVGLALTVMQTQPSFRSTILVIVAV